MPFLLFTVIMSTSAALLKLGALSVMVVVLRSTVIALFGLVIILVAAVIMQRFWR